MNEPDNQEPNNQQSMIENSVEAESLADLPLTAAQADATKAGEGTRPVGQFPWQVSV